MPRSRPGAAGLPSPAHTRLVWSVLAGAVVGAAVGALVHPALGALAAIAAMGAVFVSSGVRVLWPLSADRTRESAARENFGRRLEEALVAGAAVASLATVVVMLALGRSADRNVAAAVGLAGVATSWAMLHLMYATRYAKLYYRDVAGGIDFNNPDHRPTYQDFLYFSYNLGMTYQVSDTAVSDTTIRAVVLRHTLLSYVFGTGILAAAINLVEGVVTH